MKTIYLLGEIGYEITAKSIQKELPKNQEEKIRFIIDSPGGIVTEGVRIFNLIKSLKNDVEIIIGSIAASAASYIAMAVPKEKRKAFKNSSVMIHEAAGGLRGRARDFKIMYDRITGINNILAESYSENMNIKKDEALKMMSEDFYLTGWEKLLEYNIISDIVDEKEIDFPQPTQSNSFFDFFFAQLEKEPDANSIKEKMYQAEERALEDWKKSNADFEQIAAMLDNKKIEEPKKEITNKAQIPASAGDNKNGGVKIMNLDELKAQHPALFTEVFNLGKNAGKEEIGMNIKAHAKWFEADPKAVMENIAKGEVFTMEHLSAYSQSQLVKNSLKERELENVDDLNKDDNKTKAQVKEEDIEAEMSRLLSVEVK